MIIHFKREDGHSRKYDNKLQKWVPYLSDPDKWYQYLLDLRKGNVESHNQDRYIVYSGGKHGQLKDMETQQKEMHENQRPVVNLVTPVAQATEMAKSVTSNPKGNDAHLRAIVQSEKK